MNIDKLLAVTDIFVHESCPDGLASAMICASAYKAVGLEPKIHFLQYGTNFMAQLEARPNQMFVDITPPLDRWEEWRVVEPIVLDHHATAKHATEGLGGVYGDASYSGATLAFEHVLEPLSVQDNCDHRYWNDSHGAWAEFARLATIRDTWQEKSPEWEASMAQSHALMFYNPKELVERARDGGFGFDEIRRIGNMLLSSIIAKSHKLAAGAYYYTQMCGGVPYLLGAFNCTESVISETAHVLLNHGCDIAIGYFFLTEDDAPRVVVSLRSKGEISVKAIAEHQKGGGHERAAGFRMNLGGAHISLENIVKTVGVSLLEIAKVPGAIKPDDGRIRKTGREVSESIQTARKRPTA
jgi:hypothetical protein